LGVKNLEKLKLSDTLVDCKLLTVVQYNLASAH